MPITKNKNIVKACENIYAEAKEFASKQRKAFTSDDFKTHFLKTYLPPQHHNEIPACFITLSRLNLIKCTGELVKSKFPAAKGRKIQQWISREYSLIQQGNSKIKQPELFEKIPADESN